MVSRPTATEPRHDSARAYPNLRRGSHVFEKVAATPSGVWLVKHVVAPLDRWLLRATDGKLSLSGRLIAPVLLLTTSGRVSGQRCTTPVFYLADGPNLVICNVRPSGERPNPWVLNLRAQPTVQVQVGGDSFDCLAEEADDEVLNLYWPRLTKMWSTYARHWERGGQRAVFILRKIDETCATVPGPRPRGLNRDDL